MMNRRDWTKCQRLYLKDLYVMLDELALETGVSVTWLEVCQFMKAADRDGSCDLDQKEFKLVCSGAVQGLGASWRWPWTLHLHGPLQYYLSVFFPMLCQDRAVSEVESTVLFSQMCFSHSLVVCRRRGRVPGMAHVIDCPPSSLKGPGGEAEAAAPVLTTRYPTSLHQRQAPSQGEGG